MLTREMLPHAVMLVNYVGYGEGWQVNRGTLEIEAIEEGYFLDNDEAAQHVRAVAAQGSAIHKLAIECAMLPHQPCAFAVVQ